MFRSSKPIRSNPIKKLTSSLKRGPLKRSGKKQKEWKEFRDAKAKRDDERGEYYCHHKDAWSLCYQLDHVLDLHHLVEREVAPALYFEETNLIWLCRRHHEQAHNSTY